MPKLIATVGIPGSGKTTYMKQLGIVTINPDSIRLALTGKAFFAPAEKFVWASAKLIVESMFIYGYEQVGIDATNITYGVRKSWISEQWETEWLVFNTPIEVCKKRVIEANKHYLLNVIDRMVSEFQHPSEDEGIVIYV